MSVEGIFRKNGNIRKLKEVCEEIDTNPSNVHLMNEGPIQVAALTKKFLRELPEPLLTFKLHKLFTSVHRKFINIRWKKKKLKQKKKGEIVFSGNSSSAHQSLKRFVLSNINVYRT